MELKYKRNDIIFHRSINTYYKVLAQNNPFPGMYTILNLKTGKATHRNRDIVESSCILCTNPKAVEVLFGSK